MDVILSPEVRERARAHRRVLRWLLTLATAAEVFLTAFVAGLPLAAGLVYLAIEVSR